MSQADFEPFRRFDEAWSEVVRLGDKVVSTHIVVAGDEESWAEARSEANRWYGQIRHLLDSRTVRYLGDTPDVFDFVLGGIPALGDIRDPNSRRAWSYSDAATTGTAIVNQVKGRLEAEAARPKQVTDSDRLAAETRIDKFLGNHTVDTPSLTR